MIETSEQLEALSQKATASEAESSLKYIPPSEVADIQATRKLAYELYSDEDTRKWNINSAASVVLGANAVLVAIISGLLYTHVSNGVIALIVAPLVLSIGCSILALKPRNSKRPKMTGDTAATLGLSEDEYAGVMAYTYAHDFFYNRDINGQKLRWLKRSLAATASTFLIAASAVLALIDGVAIL
ncbi:MULTISPECIES: hypothetical protein [unclassified Natrinema]|uniref:hypothetical protein n=1 Tax=unclassified Natrinema TaxID=2622230 RepID=UPI00026D49C7|nr:MULTISPECIES: hypothetical protein [unclassified Natrinema]AFO58517.1 hypothetical protein NJ7G_3298 [Natrinema sp. J7-2]